jgi:ribonuclease E
MANKMLIDASHPEETRVVVLRGNRVEEFDFESVNRKQLRGNIYLAKVTRVEPSLQAAFVDYGGNRHGFLAFSEIHPDYYQIPVADRQALIEEEERAQRAADAEAEHRSSHRRGRQRSAGRRDQAVRSEPIADEEDRREPAGVAMEAAPAAASDTAGAAEAQSSGADVSSAAADALPPSAAETPADASQPERQHPEAGEPEDAAAPFEEAVDVTSFAPGEERPQAATPELPVDANGDGETASAAGEHASDSDVESREAGGNGEANGNGHGDDAEGEEDVVESVGGGDALEEVQERMARPRRQYKIQEVIKRRQVMLVQVVKEERGTKGAALTTYLSLAGRYSVLMPNTSRGGGISRKITSAEDRRRLKDIAQELEVPEGMGVILRTAGASRTKTEVKRDFEYLLRLWETVRDLTLKSTAPRLVYEEGSLVKRSIRDLYNKDIDDIIVGGDDGYREAKDFMRMLMPSHAKNVKQYKDHQPLFTRYGIESQLDAMFSPVVQLRSGGYIVINQAEALVAIDVNSGRATREHHIEDTALKTNVEAAEEIARQLRLRDLAGLIVIDFIDMDEKRNNRTVERKLKDSLKHDRARIQVGRISHFGLLEMSRQRIRSSVLESSTDKCPECGGTGHVRSISSVALQLLRALEEMLIKGATHNLIVRTRTEVALYVLNHKRAHLRGLEERFQLSISVNADASVNGAQPYIIDRGEQVHTPEAAKALVVQPDSIVPEIDTEDEEQPVEEAAAAVVSDADADVTQTEQQSPRQDAEPSGRENRRKTHRWAGNPPSAMAPTMRMATRRRTRTTTSPKPPRWLLRRRAPNRPSQPMKPRSARSPRLVPRMVVATANPARIDATGAAAAAAAEAASRPEQSARRRKTQPRPATQGGSRPSCARLPSSSKCRRRRSMPNRHCRAPQRRSRIHRLSQYRSRSGRYVVARLYANPRRWAAVRPRRSFRLSRWSLPRPRRWTTKPTAARPLMRPGRAAPAGGRAAPEARASPTARSLRASVRGRLD